MRVDYPALVFADLHAQKKIMPEMAYFFSKTVPEAYKKHKCKSIIIVGDVFHVASQIDTELYTMVFNNLRWLKERLNTTIHLVMGNHDMFMVDVSPLIPFSTICNVYAHTTITEDGTEFIPYNDIPNELCTKQGNTFIHYALKDVLDSINFNYGIKYLDPQNKNRWYYAGHIHTPVFKDHVVSLGCPIQWMFDDIMTNKIYAVYQNTKDEEGFIDINTNITKFNVIDVHSLEDLNKPIEYGEIKTFVKLKIHTEEVTKKDIDELKKEINATFIIQRTSTPTKIKGTLDTNTANNPADIYRQFLQQCNTTFNKRELYQLVLEKISNENRISKDVC